jgi:RNA polymerase sigma factor (sigma-70 family)
MYASTTEQQRYAEVQVLATKLYRERYRYLFRIAVKNAANEADAEEALQDAFVSFIDRFDPVGSSPPLAWLTLTLKRRCWALHRAQHFDRRAGQEAGPDSDQPGFCLAEIPSTAPGVEERIERAEFVLEARESLAALKPAERRALSLIAAGFSYKEIAEMNEWTYTKVNRCASEGRVALRNAPAG